MSSSLSKELGTWVSGVSFDDLPQDVVDTTKLRVLDVMGLMLAGTSTGFGRSACRAAEALGTPGPCHAFGTEALVGAPAAALANGSAAQALEFDDTHNESIVHMSSPSVAAALALSETTRIDGRELITAVALGSEISCRVGSVAPGEFHKRGLHPTGLFVPFGVAYLAGRMLRLDADRLVSAAGIAGSLASGILQCWVDGTQSKFLHSGWAAQGGIVAAYLARAGVTGPTEVFEGRLGFFASHLQDPAVPRDFSRIDTGLGEHWESRNGSFKPFPAAHVLHPYISVALRLRSRHKIRPDQIESIRCPVASFIVPIVCEPATEKQAPATGAHGRVSLAYSLAEAMYAGRLGKDAYGDDSVRNPEILNLARRVTHHVDPEFPGPGRFKGAVEIVLKDGRAFSEVEDFNRGSAQNPMSYEELREKFDDNASEALSEGDRNSLAETIGQLEQLSDASLLAGLATGPTKT